METRYKIAVSGAASLIAVTERVQKLAVEVGKEIARQNCVLITGATVGIPNLAVEGFEQEGGDNFGFSPAASRLAHEKKYQLPTKNYDVIIYTGSGYQGRDLQMTRAAEAVIIINGRVGTLHEFAVAFGEKKPVGVLVGSGGTADELKYLVNKIARGYNKSGIIYEADPKTLVEKLIKMIKARSEKGRNRKNKKINANKKS